MRGQTDINIDVYIDSNGGVPDYASMRHVHNYVVTTINAYGGMQVQTVSDAPYDIDFKNDQETLVVVLTFPHMTEGAIFAGGIVDGSVLGTSATTFVGGACRDYFEPYSDYAASQGYSVYSNNQIYVRVHGTSSTSTSSEDSSLSGGAVAGIVIAALVVAGIAAFVAVRTFSRSPKDQSLNKSPQSSAL